LRIRKSITASERVFSPLKSVQTGLWAQSALCSLATLGFIPEDKVVGAWSWQFFTIWCES